MRSPRSELDALLEQSLLRDLHFLDAGNGHAVSAGGQELLNFSSNDYLGFARHPAIEAAAIAALKRFGTGASASRLVYGGSSPHRQLEASTAAFFGKERALTFANGYATAVGVLPAVLGKGDTAILDKRCHASLIDGARLSGATVRVFPHNGLGKLERLLAARDPDARTMVITESVFSMDGDTCPLAEIVELKNRHGALLLLDEAHAFGVTGPGGRGLAHREGLASDVDFLLATFGKAAASAGGCIAASGDWIDLIANRARSFIYSTAPPPAQAAAAAAGLDTIASADGNRRRETLLRNTRSLARSLDLPTPEAAILPYIIGEEGAALSAAAELRERGFLVPAIRYPTVARASARLRITLSAAHTEDHVARLANALHSIR